MTSENPSDLGEDSRFIGHKIPHVVSTDCFVKGDHIDLALPIGPQLQAPESDICTTRSGIDHVGYDGRSRRHLPGSLSMKKHVTNRIP